MHKNILFFLSAFLLITPCLVEAEMAQPITIPGYQPPTMLKPETETPASTTPAITLPTQAVTVDTKQLPTPATNDELQQLIASIDLSGWEQMADPLWVCAPSNFSVPMYNAKNDILSEFNLFKKNNEVLTKEKAAALVTQIGQPVNYQIVGLYGDLCRVKITVTNVTKKENPYLLNCLFILLEVRALAQLAPAVAKNNGQDTPLPENTFSAINNLLNSKCRKETIGSATSDTLP